MTAVLPPAMEWLACPVLRNAGNTYRNGTALGRCWRIEDRERHITAKQVTLMLVSPVPAPKYLQHGHTL